MARDAQMAGDRVNAEYYLQFADHYFRVLADNRARQEEQQQRFRPRDEAFDDEGDDFDTSDFGGDYHRFEQSQGDRAQDEDRRRDQPPRDHRSEQREPREERDGRNRRDRNRRDRPAFAEASDQPRAEAPVRQRAPEPQPVEPEAAASQPAEPQPEAAAEAPRARRGRPRKAEAAKSEGAEGLDLTVLPPSIARADNDSEPAAESAPRKRVRRARPAAEAAE